MMCDGNGISVCQKPFFIIGVFPVFNQILKRRKRYTGMVKYSVQDDADSDFMICIYQLPEEFVCSELGINLIVICRCVLMIEITFKYRVDIKAFYSDRKSVV